MKNWLPTLVTCLWICTFAAAENPDSVKEKVLALERKMAVALVENDKAILQELWAEDFMVNNPGNRVLTDRTQVMDRVDAGIIQYSAFEQKIEGLRVYEGMVIVMGEETVRPSRNAPGAGHILHRRFTNIWMLREGVWLLTARHANIIPPKP